MPSASITRNIPKHTWAELQKHTETFLGGRFQKHIATMPGAFHKFDPSFWGHSTDLIQASWKEVPKTYRNIPRGESKYHSVPLFSSHFCLIFVFFRRFWGPREPRGGVPGASWGVQASEIDFHRFLKLSWGGLGRISGAKMRAQI